MLEEMVSLASYGYYGEGALGDLFMVAEQNGFFSILLPFLLIFSIVFAILQQTKIFKDNKGINGVIALVVGLMALQFNFVQDFFPEIFPRLGIALAILLICFILLGMVAPHANWMTYVWFGIGAIILGVVLIQTAGAVGWSAGWWWYANWQLVVGAIIFLVVIVVIVTSGPSNSSRTPGGAIDSLLTKLLKS